jgi:hypothetical protein
MHLLRSARGCCGSSLDAELFLVCFLVLL